MQTVVGKYGVNVVINIVELKILYLKSLIII